MLGSWKQRLEILFFLSQSRMKSYAHDRVLGFLWWIFDPLFQILIYMVLMDFILRNGQEKYPLFLACAVIPWRFLAHGSGAAGVSIISNAGLLKSVNIDRIYMPASEIVNSLVYFLYALPTYAILLISYRIPPTIHLAWVPLIVLVEVVLALGLGLILSVGTVFLRDAENLWQFLLQAWFFLSPTLYPVEMIPEQFRFLYKLNPAVGIIDSFRQTVMFGRMPDLGSFLTSAVISFAVLGVGVFVFRRSENEVMRLL